MRQNLLWLGLAILVMSLGVNTFGQDSLPDIGIQENLALGVVKVTGDQKIVIATKDGTIDAVIVSETAFKRLPPDNLSLKAATDSKLSDISVGDRVLVVGKVSGDKKTILTKSIYLVKGSDIQAKLDKEREEWQTRGISGRVTEVDPQTKVIMVEIRGITGQATTIKLSPKDKIKYLRYSPQSIKYSDAVESDISKIQKDDMLRALGDKSEDGTTFKAEQVLTGAFVTVAGKVKSIDAAKNEVTITDQATQKDVTIAVNDASLLKKFPEETAQMMAMMMMRQQGGGSGVQPPNGGRGGNRPAGDRSAGDRPAGNRPERQGGGEGRGRGGRGNMDINEMLNRFPTISVADLKIGEMIAVSSPKGNDPTRLTAIKLLAGVEPFLQMQQAAAAAGGRRGGRGGVSGGLTIPGLDNIDF
ncbi:MAG: hypothetical protein ACR2MD_08580 [Aridibacter sp.]